MQPKALEPNNELWVRSDEDVTRGAGWVHPKQDLSGNFPSHGQGFYILDCLKLIMIHFEMPF